MNTVVRTIRTELLFTTKLHSEDNGGMQGGLSPIQKLVLKKNTLSCCLCSAVEKTLILYRSHNVGISLTAPQQKLCKCHKVGFYTSCCFVADDNVSISTGANEIHVRACVQILHVQLKQQITFASAFPSLRAEYLCLREQHWSCKSSAESPDQCSFQSCRSSLSLSTCTCVIQ